MSKTIWMRSSSQSASKSFLCITWLTVRRSMGAENERQAAASPGVSRLIAAAPDRGERRRPTLTRQNGKANI